MTTLASDIDTLLADLTGTDLFARQDCHARLRALGLDAVPVLLTHAKVDRPEVALALREVIAGLADADRGKACTYLTRALRRDNKSPARALALATIADHFRDLAGHVEPVLAIALDETEPLPLRARSLLVLREAALLAEQVRELLMLLDPKGLAPNERSELRQALFDCLGRHADRLPVKTTMTRLDPFLTHPEPAIRVHALDLLGAIGDLDAIERMCLLPNTSEEIRRIQDSIGRILLRPTNLLSLRPEHFEHFVTHLLRKMGHEGVERTGAPYDDGIDVVSRRRSQNFMGDAAERWVVQCKRWTTTPVDVPHLEALIATSRRHDAKHALLITTSDFTRRARDFAAQHTSAIELVSGAKLLERLDTLFGRGRYTIRPHD